MDLPLTRQSVVAAVRSEDAEVRRLGFDAMVAVYWKPVYKYIRLKWHVPGDAAQDATQEFFARAFEKDFFAGYDPGKARFRTFLRVCLDRFAANERKAAARLKRGGGRVIVPLDFETAEGELRQHDVPVPADFDDYFHREWMRSLFAPPGVPRAAAGASAGDLRRPGRVRGRSAAPAPRRCAMSWLPDASVDRLRDVAEWPVPPGDRYEIVAPLARGGMGTVYRAHDRELDRGVAIKVLAASAAPLEAAARMRQEARILARLEHPGIVPVYDVGLLEDGRVFYVMKLVQGPRLDAHAAERPLAERLRLFTRICEPVAFAHAHGVIHRDLKPDNVMVGPFGEVLVMDWGVAQVRDGGAAREPRESIVGTRAYMPPEQMRGESVDGRADVFALGGILHFLLSGAAPDAPLVAGPRALRAICRKARAAAIADRYADVPSLAADVECFLAGEPVGASPESVMDGLSRFSRKHRAAIAIVATYLAVRYLIAWLAP